MSWHNETDLFIRYSIKYKSFAHTKLFLMVGRLGVGGGRGSCRGGLRRRFKALPYIAVHRCGYAGSSLEMGFEDWSSPLKTKLIYPLGKHDLNYLYWT